MKIRSLHPKKNFLKFLILILLVLGGSVGVILATQKEAVFDDSNAMGGVACSSKDSCYSSIEGNSICINNNVYTCTGRYGRYSYRLAKKCSNGYVCGKTNDQPPICGADCFLDHSNDCSVEGNQRCDRNIVQRCTDGVWQNYDNCTLTKRYCMYNTTQSWCESLPQRKPATPKTTTIPAGACVYDCLTRYECTNDAKGKVVGGKCATGEVCCKP